MHEMDLTPQSFVAHHRAKRAGALWAGLIVVCAVAAAVPVVMQLAQAPDSKAMHAVERLAQAQSRHAQNSAGINTVTSQITLHERELKAEQHLTRRPGSSWAVRRTTTSARRSGRSQKPSRRTRSG